MTAPGDGSDFKGHLVHRPGRIEADQQTIGDLRDALDDAKKSWAHWREDSEHHNQLATTYFKNWQDSLQTIAELRKALERYGADHDSDCPAVTPIDNEKLDRDYPEYEAKIAYLDSLINDCTCGFAAIAGAAAERERVAALELANESHRAGLATYREQAERLQQALTAEREKSAEHLDAANWLTLERERLILEVERLEAERDRRLGQ